MKSWLILLILPSCLWASPGGQTISRSWYVLNYNEKHEVANWASYSLDKSQLQNCVSRTNNFRSDPLVSTGSAALSDYRNSGYDRGHLVPAGDMKFDEDAMYDTFYLSNITPQPADFNRGQWGQLEGLIRAWVRKYGKLWIVTGPILTSGLASIGYENQVSVPEEYFKAVLRKERGRYRGIAFLMQTRMPFRELRPYAIDIDSVEARTKLDFFNFLSEGEAKTAEGAFEPGQWDFTARFDYSPCEASGAQ